MKDLVMERIVCRLTKLYIFIGLRLILAPIIIDVIVSIFYKATHNAKPAFNPVTANFFTLFRPEKLPFLFAIVHYKISEY